MPPPMPRTRAKTVIVRQDDRNSDRARIQTRLMDRLVLGCPLPHAQYLAMPGVVRQWWYHAVL